MQIAACRLDRYCIELLFGLGGAKRCLAILPELIYIQITPNHFALTKRGVVMNSKIQIELSPRILQKVQRLINEGWFRDASDFFETTARYYLERHTDEMLENYVEHEIKAGLHAEY